MRILILGDSNILYKKNRDIFYNNTYAALLKEKLNQKFNDLHEVLVIGSAGNNIILQINPVRIFYDIKQFTPNIIIIQLGINDTALYCLTNPEQLFIKSIPKINNFKIYKFYKTIRLFFLKFNKIKVNQTDFSKYFKILLAEILSINTNPIIINIPKPRKNHFINYRQIIRKIRKYNSVLTVLSEKYKIILIDLFTLTENDPKMLLKDSFILSKLGHCILANKLIKKLELLLPI